MRKEVIIIGAGGHARVIADIVKSSGDELVGFLDDNVEIHGAKIFDGKIVLGDTTQETTSKYADCYFVIGIGNNNIRRKIAQNNTQLKWYTAIHPSAVIGSDVVINEGTVIMAGAVLNTGTIIGKHCIINTCSSLDHNNILEDYVHVSPGAHLAGDVKIGVNTWIGAGATIINGIRVAKNTMIGAGATVIRNIEKESCTFIGTPARQLVKPE